MFTKNRSLAVAALAVMALLVLFGVAAAGPKQPAVNTTATPAVAASCTTDAGGYCTVPHDLGAVPTTVLLTPVIATGATPYALSAVAGQFTATTVKVRAVRVSNGAALAGTAINFSMLVLGVTPPVTSPPDPTTSPATTTPATSTSPTTTPPPSDFPTAATTGVPAGTVLTVVTGDQTITTAGTVIDGKDIRGCVLVRAPRVVIKNSKVACTSFYSVDSYGYSVTGVNDWLTIQDSEIHCNISNGTGVGELHVVVRRVNIHGCENGFDADSDFDIQDSYIHDLYQSSVAHTDGLQSAVGSNLLINHNTWYANDGTSAININNSASGPTSTNTTVSNNLLAGGAFSLYCPIPPTVNFRVTGNHFSTVFYPTVGAFGPWTDCEGETTSGNVYHESGQPLS